MLLTLHIVSISFSHSNKMAESKFRAPRSNEGVILDTGLRKPMLSGNILLTGMLFSGNGTCVA